MQIAAQTLSALKIHINSELFKNVFTEKNFFGNL